MESGCRRKNLATMLSYDFLAWPLLQKKLRVQNGKKTRNWLGIVCSLRTGLSDAIQTVLILWGQKSHGESWEDKKFSFSPSENHFTKGSQKASKLMTVILPRCVPQLCWVGLAGKMVMVEGKPLPTWADFKTGSVLCIPQLAVCPCPLPALKAGVTLTLRLPSWISLRNRGTPGTFASWESRCWLGARH